jgi:hypothetical protein
LGRSTCVGNARDVALDTSEVLLDLEAFFAQVESALALVRGGSGQEAVAQLEAAEAAYAGDFLEEDLYEDWAIGALSGRGRSICRWRAR